MALKTGSKPLAARAVRARIVLELVAFALAMAVTVWSAQLVRRSSPPTPLVSVTPVGDVIEPLPIAIEPAAIDPSPLDALEAADPMVPEDALRWFNGRPVRPAKTVWMTVTAYSPDHRSCGIFADGKTATLHSVWTNGMRLVAADPEVLPMGSMLTVPGYASDTIVPVLDKGGAIKGARLDVLYATHGTARKWGVQRLPVTVWEYADGLPAPDPRKER